MDGTVVKTDTHYESVLALLNSAPRLGLFLPFWLAKGKAHFKQRVAELIDLNAALLPYNEPFVAYLRDEQRKGRTLVLVTAANEKIARDVADHLGLFDKVIASDKDTNLSGPKKLARLQSEFGDKGFDFAGNSRADLAIFPHAHRAMLVNADSQLKAAANRSAKVDSLFDREPVKLKSYGRLMRLHQWSKNFLIFLPLILAHKVGDLQLFTASAIAFVAFCLCASSTYLLNDLLDLNSDRQHPSKRSRPLADGTIPLQTGVLLFPFLMLGGFGLALSLPGHFFGTVVLYYVSTILYSFAIKRMLILDVICLAGLYTLRILAGAEAVQVVPSFWLLTFSGFFFLSLAMVKRYCELQIDAGPEADSFGRSYKTIDAGLLESLGGASGYTAVLVLALYIDSDNVRILYTSPEAFWFVCPVVLYWVSRLWLKAKRGEVHDDPVIYALRDPSSLWMGCIILLIVLYAI